MVKRRSKEDIILKLLETCINGATKTDIVYQGSLNFRTVKPYMNLLKKKSLILNRSKSILSNRERLLKV
jgi:predicted transcriptional regulator